jgi:hypothetical protein
MGVSHYGLAIYIKMYLTAKEELQKLKYFTIEKYGEHIGNLLEQRENEKNLPLSPTLPPPKLKRKKQDTLSAG